MPPIMSIDGVSYQVRIKWLVHSQECLNVLHFVNRGSSDILTTLVQPILDCITTNLLPVLSDECTLIGADFKAVTGSVAQEGEIALVSANVGGDADNSLPSFNAAVVNLRTNHPGRTGRGKMFLTGISEGNQANSQLDATFIAAAVAFLACMVSAYVNSDPLASPFYHWSVFSRKDTAFYPVQTATPNPTVASMRSRKLGS